MIWRKVEESNPRGSSPTPWFSRPVAARAAVPSQSGGAWAIRTPGACYGHASLAVRCLQPLGQRSIKLPGSPTKNLGSLGWLLVPVEGVEPPCHWRCVLSAVCLRFHHTGTSSTWLGGAGESRTHKLPFLRRFDMPFSTAPNKKPRWLAGLLVQNPDSGLSRKSPRLPTGVNRISAN